MITLLSHRHLYDEEGLSVALIHIAITTSSELSDVEAYLQSKGLKAHEGSKAWDITNSVEYSYTADGSWHEWASENSIVTIKGRVNTVGDLPSNAEPGWMYFVGLSTDSELAEYVYTDSGNWEYIGSGIVSIDDALSATSENPVQNKVIAEALGILEANAITGVIPMITAGTLLWMPMGVVVCFGTLFTLPLVITILPVAYCVAFENKKRVNHRPVKLS